MGRNRWGSGFRGREDDAWAGVMSEKEAGSRMPRDELVILGAALLRGSALFTLQTDRSSRPYFSPSKKIFHISSEKSHPLNCISLQ